LAARFVSGQVKDKAKRGRGPSATRKKKNRKHGGVRVKWPQKRAGFANLVVLNHARNCHMSINPLSGRSLV
jgi:hypothetical protein